MAEATTVHALRRALARAGAGKALSVGEIEALLGARGSDLRRLMSLASHLRELGHGSTVTYSRKVFVPLTMLCRDHCHYCTFAKPPARLERVFLSPEEVVAIAEAGRRLGCKEALFTLGDRPEERYPMARAWLAERGYRSTLEYVRAAAIRELDRRYRHIQEVIVQNFRAKPGTAMHDAPEPGHEEFLATVATARVVFGPRMHVQAPPNLSDPEQQARLLEAGIDDWGGVSPLTPDHVNPERPWPAIEELASRSATAGFALHERLTIYPEYARRGEPWLDPRLAAHVAALLDQVTGLAVEDARPVGRPWQEPDGGHPGGRTDLFASIDTTGRTGDRRGDFDSVYGDWSEVAAHAAAAAPGPGSAPERLDGDVLAGLRLAAADPARLLDAAHESAALALFHADGAALDELAKIADDLRRDTVGDDVTYVVNRNINFTNVCYVGCRFCAFAQRERDADAYRLSVEQVADRAEEAWLVGATEVCMQGGIDPKLPVTGYADLVRAVKARVPGMHVHAFSPMEIVTASAKAGVSIREWLLEMRAAGLDTIPGTAAEILDDEVRWVLTKGKLPAATWVEVVTTAHSLGIRSSSTMMYGHVDHPKHWLGHFRTLAEVQDRTGGFTEFVALPFVHHNAPIYLAGIARPGPTHRDNRAVHAMARLLLHGRISNIQCSWVKLGDEGTVAMLRGGANDLGGTLMEETISRMAGSEHGSARTVAQLRGIAAAADRPARERTTTYGTKAVVPLR